MKLDNHDLARVADFAKAEMRDRIKGLHESHDAHLARCWVNAIIRVANASKGELMYLDEKQHLTKFEDP